MNHNQSFTEIHCAFEELTKEQLTRLRKMADYPIKSNLNKAALVDALEENFRKDPVKLLMQLPVFDLEYLSEMCKMGRDQCMTTEEFPDLLYIQEFNLCEWDYSKGGSQQDMWLTDDMYYLISPFIDQVLKDVTESGRCLIDFLFWGMIWLYGFFGPETFIEVFKKKFGNNDETWLPIYSQLLKYFPFDDYYNRDGFIVHPAIGEYDYMLGERRSRGFDLKPLKEYTFEEILKVGATGPYFRYEGCEKECNAAVDALKKCGISEEVSRVRLSRVWRDVQDIDGPNRPTQTLKMVLGGEPEMDSIEELDSVAGAIFAYMNNIPRWCLGGRSPEDVPVPKEHREQMAAFTVAMDRVSSMMENTPHIGRNDPCPCGSGLKYKNCHGKNYS